MLTQGGFERLLDRWIAEGRVDPGQRPVLLADVQAAGRLAHPASVVAVFAAILVVLAVIAFVAANWQVMPRGLRLAVLSGALLGAHGGALVLLRRSSGAVLGHALLLVGAGAFGAALALVSQMYHLDGDLAGLLGLWAIGAVATAAAGRSRGPLWLAGGLIVWMGLEGDGPWLLLAVAGLAGIAGLVVPWRLRAEWVGLTGAGAILAYSALDVDRLGMVPLLAAHLVLWAGGAAADDGRRAWPGGVRVGNLILALLAVVLVVPFGRQALSAEHSLLPASVVAVLCALAAGLAWRAHGAGRLDGSEGAALLLLAALTVTAAVVPPEALMAIWVWPGVVLAVAVLLATQDARTGRKGRLTLAVLVFAVQALIVYAEHEAGLLASAGFFLVGGFVLAAASVVAARRAREERP